ncbi:MAG: oxygen-independent coproporphyrinogen III oxidase [Chitinophagales bacterium]
MLTGERLIRKYNYPVPRYTSYPTVPYWHGLNETKSWRELFREKLHDENIRNGISLYIHLPFCESLCTYCACNKKITTNHQVEEEYTKALLNEWDIYCNLMEERPVIRELHLGGGTPTFFSANNLRHLLERILSRAIIHPRHAFSIEGHPNNTSTEHLKTLYDLGFRRISYGVQDNDPLVQRAINRIQPIENVRRVTEDARSTGFTSVNFDLVYGLPFQTLEGEGKTIDEIITLRPDRIAFYSYAHVPWKMKAQRLFDENDLPSAELKTQIYLLGREMFTDAGYHDIGMDHFALPSDDLYHSFVLGMLHRNFMGYTALHSEILLGLGVSSISDIGIGYAQNHHEIENYYRSIKSNELAIHKGYFLDETDQAFKKYILEIACRGRTSLRASHRDILDEYTLPMLKPMEEDGLLRIEGNEIIVSQQGQQFIRVICQAFDIKWQKEKEPEQEKKFSRAI